MPIITSLSTRFFGQPRLTNPTLTGVCGLGSFGADLSCSGVTVRFSTGMQSLYFIIAERMAWAPEPGGTPGPEAQITASPVEFGRSGRRNFFIDESAIIRVTSEDRPATERDDPLQ